MQVLMFGPGGGHNIQPFLKFFNESSQHTLTYVYSGQNQFSDYKNIQFIPDQKVYTGQLKSIIKNHQELIWVHGAYAWKRVLQISLLRHPNSHLNLNIWGEQVPRLALDSSIKARIYRWLFKKASTVQFNWYGTKNILKRYDSNNFIVFPWGLDENYFKDSSAEIKNETKQFIKSLPQNKFKFFYPKSVLPSSSHELITEAAALLKETTDQFIIYFWVGNATSEEITNSIKEKIKKYQLDDNVKFVKHSFLPFKDIKEIWQQMDCGLQIAKSDQLSTTLLEPMLLQKPVIASQIEPYQIFEKEFKVNLDLVPLEKVALTQALSEAMQGQRSKPEDLKQKYNLVKENFNFNKNLEKNLSYFQKLKK